MSRENTEVLVKETAAPLDGSRDRRSRLLTLAALSLIVLVGSYLRLSDLGAKSITHPEMYVPGIRMPEGLSQPRQRLTLTSVLTGTFSSDTHPPGYYVLMWPWTKLLGTSTWSIRLPSALLGISSIALVFWLGCLTHRRTAGLLAAALLSVNGYHVFWSRAARMFSLACFLGLLATILLLVLAREQRHLPALKVAYVAVVLLGLATHIFFWLLLGTHMLWTALNAWSSKQPFPGLLKLQVLVLIPGSSLLAFAAYQSGTTLATMSNDIGVYMREFVQFSFLFPLEGFSSGVFLPSSPYPPISNSDLPLIRWVFVAISSALLVAGIASVRGRDEQLLGDSKGPATRAWILSAAVGMIAILGFVISAETFAKPRPYETLRITKALIVLPLLLAAGGIFLFHYWERLIRPFRAINSRFIRGGDALILMLAIIPFSALCAVSLVKPILNARGLMFVAPYLLFLLAGGLVVCGRNRWVAGLLVLVLAVAHASSIRAYSRMALDPADYKALAAQLASRAENSDLVFFNPKWYSTPMLYYLSADRYRLVGRDFMRTSEQNRRSRVWVLLLYNEPMPGDMQKALQHYRPGDSLEVPHARAVLYNPAPP